MTPLRYSKTALAGTWAAHEMYVTKTGVNMSSSAKLNVRILFVSGQPEEFRDVESTVCSAAQQN
jgi:hypothetical protein